MGRTIDAYDALLSKSATRHKRTSVEHNRKFFASCIAFLLTSTGFSADFLYSLGHMTPGEYRKSFKQAIRKETVR